MDFVAALYILDSEPLHSYSDMSIDERRNQVTFYSGMLQRATRAISDRPSDPRAPLRFVIQVSEHAVPYNNLLASFFC